MRIGISVGCYLENNYDIQGLKRMKKHGYDCMDYNFLTNTDTEIYNCSESEFVAELTTFKENANREGIDIYQTHAPWRWPVQDSTEQDRAERFEKMVKAIRATAILGAKYFVLHPLMPYGADSNPNPQQFWEINLEFLSRLINEGEKNGVVICLENMPMKELTLSKPEDTLKMVKEINSPWLKICLDTGHCSVLDISPADAVREIGKEYLATLHIHDNLGKNDGHLMPFCGIIDWADFSSALKEIGFDGVFSLETDIANSISVPKELKEYFEIGLFKIAKYITR